MDPSTFLYFCTDTLFGQGLARTSGVERRTPALQPVEWAGDAAGAALEHVRVDHRGRDIVMPQ